MAHIVERTLRQFWLPGISNVSGKLKRGLQAYLLDDRYRVFKPPISNQFSITPFETDEIKRAVCFDINRMASAAFESAFDLAPPVPIDKSYGWAGIRCYYAAFFAAHAVIRIFGKICTQLDSQHLNFVSRITSYTFAEKVSHSSGLYFATWDETNSTLEFTHTSTVAQGGSHEVTWKLFHDVINQLENQLLDSSAVGILADLQATSLALKSLRDALSESGCNHGNWLSTIRNRLNYRHEFDAWFPYGKPSAYYHNIRDAANDRWLNPPTPLSSAPLRGRELERAIEVSGAVVALCRCIIEDMIKASPGDSFLSYGPRSILELARNK